MSAAGGGRLGWTLEDLAFIRDRVMAEIRANPSQRPYLGEPAPRPPKTVCKHGHIIGLVGRTSSGQCRGCDQLRKRQRRLEAPR